VQVKGMGACQMDAEGAYSCQPGHRARELWPRDVALPPQYCTGCRGEGPRCRTYAACAARH